MTLEIIEIYNGISCLIFVIISVIVGFKIVLKYFKYKYRQLLFAGIAWIFMSEPWWSPSISFLLILTTGIVISNELFFIISISMIPIALLFWLAAFTELLLKKKQKIILVIFAIEGVIIEIFSFYFLFTNPDLIIQRQNDIDANFLSFVLIYLISVMCIILITGLLFSRESLRSNNPENKLKGKFIAAAFISFIVGGVFDAFLPLDIITMLIYRIILISSSIEFYFGLFLPNWMKKSFIKEK